MSTLFDSPDRLRDAFAAGLERLLDDPGLGAYILVLANAVFDPRLYRRLQQGLDARYREHAQRLRDTLAGGHEPADAADDLLVFLKLMAIGPAALGLTERRRAGPWEVQFNLLRAFRPTRMSAGVGAGMQVPFDPNGFHFNKPFLQKEVFWQGELGQRRVDLLYNKFPFVDLHGLLVPERETGMPQFLTRDWHDYVWRLSEDWGARLPGLGFGYNSYGAHASVNHLHFQMFVRQRPLPVALDDWIHNGGEREYPAECLAFDDPGQSWRYLDHLHREAHPYNLVYLPGRLFCLPRARQGDYEPSAWTSGFAWSEMAGCVVAFNREDYAALQERQVTEEMRRIGVRD